MGFFCSLGKFQDNFQDLKMYEIFQLWILCQERISFKEEEKRSFAVEGLNSTCWQLDHKNDYLSDLATA